MDSAASQIVLGSVGKPLVSAKPKETLIPERDVKDVKSGTTKEQGAPKRSLISLRGMLPHSRISTDMVLEVSMGLLCISMRIDRERKQRKYVCGSLVTWRTNDRCKDNECDGLC